LFEEHSVTMKLFVLIGLALVSLGCVCIYLASPNQRWLPAPWRARPARWAGVLLLLGGGVALARQMQLLTTIFVFATVLMLLFSVLPYLGALLSLRRRGQHG
jgi:uncharacterized membrane protein